MQMLHILSVHGKSAWNYNHESTTKDSTWSLLQKIFQTEMNIYCIILAASFQFIYTLKLQLHSLACCVPRSQYVLHFPLVWKEREKLNKDRGHIFPEGLKYNLNAVCQRCRNINILGVLSHPVVRWWSLPEPQEHLWFHWWCGYSWLEKNSSIFFCHPVAKPMHPTYVGW